MRFDLNFYLIDHRLLALAMVAVLGIIVELVYRWGARWKDAPDSLRSLVSGIGAAMLGILGVLLGFTLLICAVILLIMDVNRPQRGAIGVGVATVERVQESIAPSKP